MPLVVGAFIQFVAVGGSRWTINRFFILSSPPVASQGVRQSGSHFPPHGAGSWVRSLHTWVPFALPPTVSADLLPLLPLVLFN